MSRPNRVNELAARVNASDACVRAADLVAEFGHKTLRSARTHGLVAEILPRVYVPMATATAFEVRVAALALWLPRTCVVSGLAALHLLELAVAPPTRITVIAPRELHFPAPAWMCVRRTGFVRTRETRAGVMCAARERAVIDAWVDAEPRNRVSTVLEAMRRSNLKGAAVSRELARMPRVVGRRELVRILREASTGIQSYLEHRAYRTVLNTADFRDLERQVDVFAMGKKYTVDTYHRATKTVIEFDGAMVHGSYAAKKRDNARDAALATLGIVTVRISYEDVMTRPAWCREVIRRVIAARWR